MMPMCFEIMDQGNYDGKEVNQWSKQLDRPKLILSLAYLPI
jgi:hypothetical protein